jgi:hypothetical protein
MRAITSYQQHLAAAFERALSFAIVVVQCEPCSDPVRGAFASGDDALDRETEDAILTEAASGNDWAWCDVRVCLSFGEISGESSWLGGCSYSSEADFRANSMYYEDLLAEAAENLRAKLQPFVDLLSTL